MVKLNNTFGFSKSLLDTIKLIGDSTESVPVSTPKSIISKQHLVEKADKTYPFKANQLAPLVVQLRSILNFLSKSGLLNRAMKENRELFDVYVDSEITNIHLDEMIKFVDTLVEGRPKGSTNKNKIVPNSMPNSENPKVDGDDDDDDDDAYPPASRPGGDRHVMTALRRALDTNGGEIETQNGSRKVTHEHALAVIQHLQSLPPADRADHSAILFGSKPNPEITPKQKKMAELMKGFSDEVPDNKKGRGRPKQSGS